jgi:hypothetical protein
VVKTEVSCDRCQAIISADRTKLAIETGPLRTVQADANGEAVIDLCRECAEALRTWLRRSEPVRNCGGTRAELRRDPCGIAEPV